MTAPVKNQKKRLRIKIISLGDANSGKSCIIKRYCEKRFVPKYMQTIGIDYGVTKYNDNGLDVRVNIFDFAGHPIFYEVRNEFYRDTQGVLLVYDVTNRESFRHLDDWLLEMRKYTSDVEDFIVAVCANKTDIGRRVISEDAGRDYAEKKGFLYFELSAYSGKGVNEMFSNLFTDVIKNVRYGKPKIGSVNLGYTREQADIIVRIKNSKDDYDILGVSRSSPPDEVKKAYKKLCLLLHPDKNLAPGATDAFKALQLARNNILNR